MAKTAKLQKDDLARVVQSDGKLGPTLWLVEFIGERGYCVLREAGNPLSGGKEFDVSMLRKVPRT